jgi:outer membrane protein OmpA-like peptidoglycan-associated protein
LDPKDLCPNEPETKNGTKDDDGCPDETMAVVKGDKLVILEKVLFVNAKDVILKRSFPLLDYVTKTLLDHPELKRIRVEGHTDSVGNDATNQTLSEKRANAVMRYLVKAGVDPERLIAVGYGEARPIDTNDTEEGRERNRRVDFTILEAAPR